MRPPPPPPPLRPLYLHEVPSTSTGFRFLSTSDLRGPPSGGQEERMERWNSPAEKEARRERKTGSAPKVSEKGGWIVHRESVRKKDGRAGHRDGRHTVERGVEGTKETCRREEEFEGVGCRHRRGRRRFLPRCRRRRRPRRPPPPPPSPSSCRRRFSTPGRQASPFFFSFFQLSIRRRRRNTATLLREEE